MVKVSNSNTWNVNLEKNIPLKKAGVDKTGDNKFDLRDVAKMTTSEIKAASKAVAKNTLLTTNEKKTIISSLVFTKVIKQLDLDLDELMKKFEPIDKTSKLIKL